MKTYYSPKEIKDALSGYATDMDHIAQYPRLKPEQLLFGLGNYAPGQVLDIYPQADSLAKLIDHPNMNKETLEQALSRDPNVQLAFLHSTTATQTQFDNAVEFLFSLDPNKVRYEEYVAAMAHPLSSDKIPERIFSLGNKNRQALRALFAPEANVNNALLEKAENSVPIEKEYLYVIEKIIASGKAKRDYFDFVTLPLYRDTGDNAEPNYDSRKLLLSLIDNTSTSSKLHEKLYQCILESDAGIKIRECFFGALINSKQLPEKLAERIIDDISERETIRTLFFKQDDFINHADLFAGLLQTHALRQKLLPLLLDEAVTEKIKMFSQYMTREDFDAQPIDDLLNVFKGWVPNDLVSNPNITSDYLDVLADHFNEFIRCKVSVHPNLSDKTAQKLKWVREEVQDSGTLFGYISESNGFPTLKGMDNLDVLRSEYGYDLFDFFNEQSQARTLKTLIGSKHKEEIRFFFGANDASAITAISSLQTLFTNNKGKQDRMGYLEFLAVINEGLGEHPGHAGLAVDVQTLRGCLAFFSIDELIAVLKYNRTDEAKDIFRMTATLIENDDPEESARQARMIRKWLNTNGASDIRFHDYLVKKESRQQSKTVGNAVFSQALPTEKVKALSSKLPEGWELNLPSDSKTLRKLGREQRHCVGSKFYADRCRDGSNTIFSLSYKEQRNQTYTFQFGFKGRLEQAKGFANSHVPNEVLDIAKTLLPSINKAIEQHRLLIEQDSVTEQVEEKMAE